jgi:chemotaxis methyl-accepting protein methylase
MIEITDKEFSQLVDFIKTNYGINIKEEKRAMLTGRLYNTLTQYGYSSFTEFYNKLVSDNSREAVITLVNKITTNHTFFMRESDHFDFFKSTVLPYLDNEVTNKDLRIWCAACSTGEESYTLAMLIDEYFGSRKLYWDSKLLASDISEKALEIAHSNAIKHGVSKRISFVKSNLFEHIHMANFDIIVSNPPYARRSEIPYLQRRSGILSLDWLWTGVKTALISTGLLFQKHLNI